MIICNSVNFVIRFDICLMLQFLQDDGLLNMWFNFLSMFQGIFMHLFIVLLLKYTNIVPVSFIKFTNLCRNECEPEGNESAHRIRTHNLLCSIFSR